MKQFDAVVIIDGSYRGWVGYFLCYDLNHDGFGEVKIFPCSGGSHVINTQLDNVQCVEPKINNSMTMPKNV